MSRFTNKQVEELLEIIELQNIIFIGENIGVDILSTNDIELLRSNGLTEKELSTLYTPFEESYHFGILSEALGDKRAKDLSYADFKKFLRSGEYIPLTDEEERTLDYLKKRSYGYIKGAGNKIQQDLSDFILEQESKTFGDIIKEEAITAVERRKSVGNLVSEIGNKTGEWNRNLGRIAETEMNNAFQTGRAIGIAKNSLEKDPLVYKDTYPGVCRHCIKAYLTKGVSSPPKVFRLSELINNGTNVGKKVADWKPTVGSLHPFCRCTLNKYDSDYSYNEKTRKFDKLKTSRKNKVERKSRVQVTVGDKKYLV